MYTRSLIRRHINSEPLGTIFSNRDFLQHGLRATVDQALWVMKKRGEILALARGLFMKMPDGDFELPSAKQIAEAKARAFGKEIYTAGADASRDIKISAGNKAKIEFSFNGRSTSFDSVHGRIHFQGTTSKNVKAGDAPAGLITRALKALSSVKLNHQLLATISARLMRTQRSNLKQQMRWMPAWISDAFFKFWYGRKEWNPA